MLLYLLDPSMTQNKTKQQPSGFFCNILHPLSPHLDLPPSFHSSLQSPLPLPNLSLCNNPVHKPPRMPSSEETPAPPFSIILWFSALVRNPTTGSVFLIGGPIIPDQPIKDGPLPASKASIEAMPTVKVTESGFECAICLGECGVGEEVKEMPCKHRYHSGCVEKWLGIHGSCPVCRFKMPVEEEGQGNRKGGDRGEGGDEIWVSLFVGGGRRDSDRNSENGSENSSGGQDMERMIGHSGGIGFSEIS